MMNKMFGRWSWALAVEIARVARAATRTKLRRMGEPHGVVENAALSLRDGHVRGKTQVSPFAPRMATSVPSPATAGAGRDVAAASQSRRRRPHERPAAGRRDKSPA